MPVIIFSTVHNEHAIQAFEVNAVDYLLKPYDRQRFNKAVERGRQAVAMSEKRPYSDQIENLLQHLDATAPPLSRLAVNSGDKIVLIPVEQIIRIEAAEKYVYLHTRVGRYMIRQAIGRLETQLDSDKFLRIHRGHIVNLDHVKSFARRSHGNYTIIMPNGDRIASGWTYQTRIQQLVRNAATSS